MKKLLSTLGALSMVVPIIGTTMSAQSIEKSNLEKVNYSLGGFKNVIKIFNRQDHSVPGIDSEWIDSSLDQIVPEYYFDSIDQKEGRVLVWKETPQNDTKTIKTYSNTYVNDSPFDQKRLTQSRTEEVSGSNSFSMSLSESIVSELKTSISGSFSIPTAKVKETVEFKFGVETGKNREWSESKTTSITETIPSQEIIQSAHTILHVKYIITQGTNKYDGVVQFKIDNFKEKLFRIPLFYFDDKGDFDYITWGKYSTEEVVQALKDSGYQKQLMVENTSEYSILSVDNIDSPKNVFINLPISWSSEDSGIRLEHYEEKL